VKNAPARLGLAFWGPVSLAAALRLLRIGYQSFWADEIASVDAARTHGVPFLLWFHADPHPPLFFALLKFWLPFGSGEGFLRTFPALAGTAAVAMTWLLARRIAGARVATIAALGMAISPLAIWTSQELRGMALLSFLAPTATLLLVRYLDDGGRGRRWAFIAVSVLALYTHYYAFFVVAFLGLWALVAAGRAKDGPRKALTSFVWIGAGFVPWLPFFLTQFAAGQGWRPAKTLGTIASQVLLYFTTSHSPWRYEALLPAFERLYYANTSDFIAVMALLLAPFLALTAVGTIRGFAADAGRGLAPIYLLVPLVLIGAASRRVNLFEPKYAACLLPAAWILVALGLTFTWEKSRGLAAALAAWAVALTALSLVHLYADPRYHRPDWRTAGARITAEATDRDAIVVYEKDTMPDFFYYYRGAAPVVPLLTRTGLDVERVADAAQVRAKLAALGPRRTVWFLDCLGFLHDPGGIARRTLDEDLDRRDFTWVLETTGYAVIRYAPKGGGG
jgi:uncharacterized membrane protein